MKIGAVIAEFNPFHTGHRLLIDSMRRNYDGVICIMSGNFVQRGECAVFDKSERTKAALLSGVDLVIELPAVYALSSAEGFATGAVSILEKTGVVDSLCFGSECGSIKPLISVARELNDEAPIFKEALSKKLKDGASFPAARVYALKQVNPHAEILNMPNNTLAVEYIRCLDRLSSPIKPATIKREGSNYNDSTVSGNIASASALRSLVEEGKSTAGYTLHTYEGPPLFMKDFDSLIAARVKTACREELCSVPDCNDEIAARILGAAELNTFREIVYAASCKSYTQSRIRRILCNLLIGNRFSTLPVPDYIRPLGFTKTGSEILSKMKSTASLDIIARGALLKDNPIFNLECRSTDIYNLVKGIRGGMEFDFVPVYA